MNLSIHTVSSKRLARAALAVVASTLFAANAFSATAELSSGDVPRVVVDYSDLRLETEHGARVLYQRISSAARQVCPGESSRDLRVAANARTCMSQAIARAVSEVNHPRLAALDAARARRSKHT